MKTLFPFFIPFFFNVLLSAQTGTQPAFRNPDLPLEERLDDLVSRMTLEEKAAQMLDQAEAIPRLGIPEYNWWNECLHGVGRAGIATVFPQAIGLAATFNPDLMFEIADVISTEARAKYHDAIAKGNHRRYYGLTFWSPNINIFRDPRWGRGQETYGEDPYLTSRMGVSFVKGLQGNHPKYFKVVATPKHYAVHSGPEPERHRFEAITDQRDLYTTYLPAFKACILEGNAYSVMCAYNRYMGEACCSSDPLLKEILRNDWNFDGYIVSDCGAISDIYLHHKLVGTAPEAAARAVKSGTDLNCGNIYGQALPEAVKQGLISEEEIDISVKRLFRARFKLGMFDPPEMVPWTHTPFSKNDSEEHRKLSLSAARESIVLLKNTPLPGQENNLLPLKKNLNQIAVIGPTADSYPMLLGNYNGYPSKYSTPLTGIAHKVGENTNVVYEQGCNLAGNDPVIQVFTPGMVHTGDQNGLKAEYFKGPGFEGIPFNTETDLLGEASWLNFRRMPQLKPGETLSVKWTGQLTMPVSGEINFMVSANNHYRILVNGHVVLEDWDEDNRLSEKSNHIYLKKGQAYDLQVEYVQETGFPMLSVQWDVLHADHFQNAIDLAKNSDVVIYVGGITAHLEGEEMQVSYDGFQGGDRTKIGLPEVQQQMIRALHETGKPVVVVLTSGSALAVNWEKENIPAIVQLWYPGQEGGTALAEVLFGDYNPAGRLPVTFYKSVDQLPPFEDYNMAGKTYRFFEGDPLYGFGYGMSYASFAYSKLKLPKKIKTGDPINVSVQVMNTGNVAGDEVVQLYVKNTHANVPVPIQSLQGIQRIHLKPSETKTVEFFLEPQQMAVFTDDEKFMAEPGVLEISVGGGQPGLVAVTSDVVSGKVKITGKPFRVEQ
jgi:beta-glucosidase